MDENQKEKNLLDLLDDPPVESKVKHYRLDEMINCAKCERTNPPNRLDCMYCGLELEISGEQEKDLRPILRSTEQWKNAVNLLYLSKSTPWSDQEIRDVSAMVRLEPEVLKGIVGVDSPMPIARSDQERATNIVKKRLDEIGLVTKLLMDDDFKLNTPVKRLRRIGLNDGLVEMTLFNIDETLSFDVKDIRLLVKGSLIERRIESSEKHSRKNDNKILETAEMSADQLVIDIYVTDDPIGYRITANGFDFSCLGENKGFIANKNINMLGSMLRDNLPNAVFDDQYVKVREYLSRVWEVDERLDSKGLKRKGFGAFSREKLTTTDNSRQFTKYSRLQWHLI